MIAAEYEPATLNRRRSPRAPVSLDAKLGRGGLDRTLCKVSDLSLHGARLMTYSPLVKGSVIWLTLPRLGQIAAKIMWADEYEAGCQFSEPLDDFAFASLTAR
ncbi:MAG: PilZ domain-containing protein [Sphingomonas sp.]